MRNAPLALNPEQREAVEHFEGPSLVLAGAGSGKTRVLTARVCHLIHEHGIPPDRIMAVTFTNKAAGEMRDRVVSMLGTEPRGIWMGTFHAIGVRLLRRHAPEVGWTRGFTIRDAEQSLREVKKAQKSVDVSPLRWSPKAIRERISEAKNQLVGAERFAEAHGDGADLLMRRVALVYPAYQEALRTQDALDFDDLLVLPVRLMERNRRLLERYRRRFAFILVDEYQDTNRAQFRLLELLASGHGNLMVVGDDDQSIYGWRGADIRNILDFEHSFPNARVVRLEQNYRSTSVILDAANAVIRRNRRRDGKTLRPLGEQGERARFRSFASETAEAQAIAIEIAAAGEGRGSTAVLLRTRAQTRAFEEAFAAHRIPHVIVGGLRFYERREVLDALACLRVAANPGDDSAFRRALAAIPRGVGPKSLRRIEEQGAEDETSLLAAAEQVVADRGLPARALNGLHAFLEGIAAVRRAIPGGPEKVVRSAIADTGLGPFFQENDRERFENLVSLQNAAREFERSNPDGTVDAFLDQVSLLSAEDLMPEEGADPGVPPVMVMTVHAAKGLEFDSVFLAGLWEGLFPHAFSLESDVQLEEERRLFYVGMTRARKRLQLSAAPGGAPYLRSRGGVSRFLGEIPRDLLDAARGEARAIPLGTVPAAGPFRNGDTVRHRKFGVGRVETVDPDGKRLSVLFRYYGRRRLVVEFARLERV